MVSLPFKSPYLHDSGNSGVAGTQEARENTAMAVALSKRIDNSFFNSYLFSAKDNRISYHINPNFYRSKVSIIRRPIPILLNSIYTIVMAETLVGEKHVQLRAS
jgi:hypothetical protein